MVQEVIVYRNPAEAAFWHSISETPQLWLGLIVGFVLFIVVAQMMEKTPFFKKASWDARGKIQLIPATIVGLASFWFFAFYLV